MSMLPGTVELRRAREVVARLHPRTPLYESPHLSARAGRRVHLKLESVGPVRSFKARGALYRLACLDGDAKARGVVTCSTGNHGQGIAYAGGLLGVTATVVIPRGTSPLKVAAMRSLGADLRIAGANLGEAMTEAHRLAASEGRVYVEDGDDAALMAGAASLAWELFEDLARPATVVVPVGGGNLIAGIALVARELSPDSSIVGVQSEAAPAVYRSWRTGALVEAACDTFAGGLATTYPGRLALEAIVASVRTMHLVSESELRQAMVTALDCCGQLVEPAAAAPFAALDRYRDEWPEGDTVLVVSGSNVDLSELEEVLTARA